MLRLVTALYWIPVLTAMLAAESAAVAETLELPRELQAIYSGKAPTTLEQLRAMERHQQKLAELVTECTVGVRVGASQGSGVLVSPDGVILTAAHVAGTPDTPCLVILSDGTQLPGRTLGMNRDRDAGMVKIVAGEKRDAPGADSSSSDSPKSDPSTEAIPRTFPHLELAPAGAAVSQGMWCLATGHPGGYQRERKPVVRLGRVLFVSSTLIRTDCVLVGGDSGGPLCDMQGRVIGIHSRIGGPITMNLHVPVRAFRDSWDRLLAGEAWGRLPGSKPVVAGAVMGVREAAGAESARIGDVEPGLPAERAGIRPGDVILKFDGKPVPDFATLVKLVQAKKPGDVVLVELRRDNELIQLKVTLAQRKPE